jgi:hypothetical protein
LVTRVEADGLVLIPEAFPAGWSFFLLERRTVKPIVWNFKLDVALDARTDDAVGITPVFVRRMRDQKALQVVGADR